MRRTMKRQSGSSLVSSCKLVDRVWTSRAPRAVSWYQRGPLLRCTDMHTMKPLPRRTDLHPVSPHHRGGGHPRGIREAHPNHAGRHLGFISSFRWDHITVPTVLHTSTSASVSSAMTLRPAHLVSAVGCAVESRCSSRRTGARGTLLDEAPWSPCRFSPAPGKSRTQGHEKRPAGSGSGWGEEGGRAGRWLVSGRTPHPGRPAALRPFSAWRARGDSALRRPVPSVPCMRRGGAPRPQRRDAAACPLHSRSGVRGN